MTKACVMLTADRVETDDAHVVAGSLQQITRLYEGDRCVCVLVVAFPAGSPEWERYMAGRTLDGMPAPRVDSIASDAAAGGAPARA